MDVEEKEYLYEELKVGWGEELPPLIDLEFDKLQQLENYEPSSWRPLPAEQYYYSDPILPSILKRDDGQAMLYEGLAHSFIGQFESLKTWCALMACKEVLLSQRNVIYVDCEGSPGPFFRRMRYLDLPLPLLTERLAYINPRHPLQEHGRLTSGAVELGITGMVMDPTLLVIDGVTEFFSLHGWDVRDATDVARYQKVLLRRFSGKLTTIEIDHVAKSLPESGRVTALGSQHKESGIDGAVFEFRSMKTGGVGGESQAAIYLVKDREGYLNSIANKDRFIGTFTMNVEQGAFIKANTGEENHDLADVVYKSLVDVPQGNKTLAQNLGVSDTRIRIVTRQLEQDGLITRDDMQRWIITAPIFGG